MAAGFFFAPFFFFGPGGGGGAEFLFSSAIFSLDNASRTLPSPPRQQSVPSVAAIYRLP